MLTSKEKAALARLLIEDLDSSTDANVEQLWIAESQRRYQAYLRGELRSVPGVRNVAAHVGRAVMSDKVNHVDSSDLWVSIDPALPYAATRAAIDQIVDG